MASILLVNCEMAAKKRKIDVLRGKGKRKQGSGSAGFSVSLPFSARAADMASDTGHRTHGNCGRIMGTYLEDVSVSRICI